jgi:hypothetical protein
MTINVQQPLPTSADFSVPRILNLEPRRLFSCMLVQQQKPGALAIMNFVREHNLSVVQRLHRIPYTIMIP